MLAGSWKFPRRRTSANSGETARDDADGEDDISRDNGNENVVLFVELHFRMLVRTTRSNNNRMIKLITLALAGSGRT